MPRYREDYTLYRRKTIKGIYVYYYRTYDENGKRTSGKSTFQTSKDAARQYVDNLISTGLLSSGPEITFENYANALPPYFVPLPELVSYA